MSERSLPRAAIDVGSNSVHLLVVALDGDRRHVLRDESELLGLGAIVDLEGRIPDADAATVVGMVRRYVASAEEEGVEGIVLLATEPLRRASNRRHVCDLVREATGRSLHVLSHEEEATLTVLGVLDGEMPAEPTLVLDIGGGSTELVLLEPDADPVIGVLPVGSARLTASFVEDDPPTADEVQALRTEAHHLLAGMPVGHPTRGLVVGGSGTNLLRLVMPEVAGDATDDDAEGVDTEDTSGDVAETGSESIAADVEDGAEDRRIDRIRIGQAIRLVMHHPAAELAALFGLRERRILQMAAGACLIEAALDCYGLEEMEASDASLREGAIIAWQRAGDAWRERLGELVVGGPSVSG